MIKPPSKQLYQLQNPIEIIGLSSDNTRNERRKQPRNGLPVLTLFHDCQNTQAIMNAEAKASKVETGMAGFKEPVRRNNRQTGLRVGDRDALLGRTSELGVTGRRDAHQPAPSFTAWRERTRKIRGLSRAALHWAEGGRSAPNKARLPASPQGAA